MSKFDKVFQARELDVPGETKTSVPKKSERATVKKSNSLKDVPAQPPIIKESEAAAALPALENSLVEPNRKRGRPTAKRSDPAYIGFTTYIRKDTHLKVKIALLQEGGQELSELVEELLSAWIKKR